MTTLDNSYCVPRTVEERAMFPHLLTEEYFGVYCDCTYGVLCFDEGDWIYENGTEIPVSRFLDILHDRIMPWRLEDAGFVDHDTQFIGLFASAHIHFTKSNGRVTIFPFDYGKGVNAYISTFTDLLTLIRMLTPPSND